MSLITCADALVSWDGITLSEANNVSIKVERGIWEIRPYYATQETAYVIKQPTWTKWSVSLVAYYDDTIQGIENGQVAQLIIYPTRSAEYYWSALSIARNVEQSVSSGFSEISATFDSVGTVTGLILTEIGNYILTESGGRISIEW